MVTLYLVADSLHRGGRVSLVVLEDVDYFPGLALLLEVVDVVLFVVTSSSVLLAFGVRTGTSTLFSVDLAGFDVLVDVVDFVVLLLSTLTSSVVVVVLPLGVRTVDSTLVSVDFELVCATALNVAPAKAAATIPVTSLFIINPRMS